MRPIAAPNDLELVHPTAQMSPMETENEPASSQPSDRLDSWKEIAAYLKRDVATVRRW